MTFGFYLKGLQDFNHWKNQLIGMSRRYSPQEFIFSLNFQEKRLELEFQQAEEDGFEFIDFGSAKPQEQGILETASQYSENIMTTFGESPG